MEEHVFTLGIHPHDHHPCDPGNALIVWRDRGLFGSGYFGVSWFTYATVVSRKSM